MDNNTMDYSTVDTSDVDKTVTGLPSGFTYLFTSNENVIRIKEVNGRDSAEIWLNKNQEHTKTTWRKAATYPNCGKINIFRVDLKCVHFTDRRAKGNRPSKI